MTTLKKIAPAFVVALCIILCATCVACDDNKNDDTDSVQYSVTFKYENGTSDLIVKVNENQTVQVPESPVKDGYNFDGWKEYGADTEFDFTAKINKDITLVAQWSVVSKQTVRIRWDSDDAVMFVFSGTTPKNVEVGTKIEFGIKVSPYYVGTPKVYADTQECTLLENGNYCFVVTKAATVTVEGLKYADAKISGLGTSKSPYLIANAAQLKTFADSINDGEDKYVESYVALVADIDLNGEKIDPIGGQKTYFMGEFDGRNHTVSNFGLNAENGVAGFFGYIATATIKNLNIKSNITIETTSKYNYILGSVVAYNIGGDIVNCNFNGSYTVTNTLDSTYMVYLGGIVGFMQGYGTKNIGTTSFCATQATLSSNGQSVLYAVGGIAGAAYGASNAATAYVNNCSFVGTIQGKNKYAGGAVGYLRTSSSVANVYVNATIEAKGSGEDSYAGGIVGLSDNETAISSSVAIATLSCSPKQDEHTTSTISGKIYKDGYNEVNTQKLVTYKTYDTTNGIIDGNKMYNVNLLDDACELLNWVKADWEENENGIVPVYNDEASGDVAITFEFGRNITREGADGNPLTQNRDVVTLTDCLPIYQIYGGDGMNTFVADKESDSDTRKMVSYGYFFDEECTRRIPASFVATDDVTVYVGFADYTKVQGDYYAVFTTLKDGEQVEAELCLSFDDNGKMTMYYDGMVANYMYVYDGSRMMIKDAYFAYLSYTASSGYSLLANYYADIVGETLEIYDNIFFTTLGSLGTITARKENAAMGTWYTTDGTTYNFLADLTGSRTNANGTETFTYTCQNNVVTMRIGTSTVMATISGTSMSAGSSGLELSKHDEFEGVWETEFNKTALFWFDADGNVRYNGQIYKYSVTGEGDSRTLAFADCIGTIVAGNLVVKERYTVNDEVKYRTIYVGKWEDAFSAGGFISFDGRGKVNYGSKSYDYVVADGKAVFEGFEAYFDEDGLLVVSDGTKETMFGREGSFIGTWTETLLNYTIALNGIGKDGYGTGTDSNGISFTYAADRDSSGIIMVNMYYQTTFYGMFNLAIGNNGEEVLYLAGYYASSGMITDDFNMTYYDPFYGTWNGANGKTYIFNGFGAYDIEYETYEQGTWIAKGTVEVSDGTTSESVRYTYDKAARTATFTVGNTTFVALLTNDGIVVDEVIFKAPDYVSKYEYHVGDDVLSFNGKSAVGLGKATLKTATGTEEFDYIVVDNDDEYIVTLTKDGKTVYVITFVNKNATLRKDGVAVEDFGLHHKLVGKEFLIAEGKTFSINGKFNINGNAKGQFGGVDVDVTYVDATYVSLWIDDTFLYYVAYLDDQNAVVVDSSSQSVAVLTIADGYAGKYVADDGSILELDGRSNSVKYGKAYATLTIVEDGDEYVYTYAYKVENGEICVYEIDRSETDEKLVLIYKISFDKVDGAKAFEDESGKTIYLVEAGE